MERNIMYIQKETFPTNIIGHGNMIKFTFTLEGTIKSWECFSSAIDSHVPVLLKGLILCLTTNLIIMFAFMYQCFFKRYDSF